MSNFNFEGHPAKNLIFTLFKASKRLIVFAILSGIVSGISSAGLIAVINSALVGSDVGWNTSAWLFIALLLVVLGSGLGSEIMLLHLAQRSTLEMRLAMSRRILSSPYQKLEEVGAHRLFATLTEDVHVIAATLQVIPTLTINGAVVIGCLAYLGWLSLTALLMVITAIAVGVGVYQLMIGKAMFFLSDARETQDSLFDHFRAISYGSKELKLNRKRRESFLSDEFDPTVKALQNSTVRGMTVFIIANQWGDLLFFTVIGLLVFALPFDTKADSAVLIGSVLTITYLMGPISAILSAFPMIGAANVSLTKIDSLGLSQNSVAHRGASNLPAISSHSWSGLEFHGVSYSYPGVTGDKFILGPINLNVNPRECIFLAGGNGSGKSTFLKIFTGLYVPEAGEIRMNGESINDEVERDHYRQYFSTVFSDYFLFEQLHYTEGMDIDARVKSYLVQLQLEKKVEVLNGRFSTTKLSQGQRKRLALLSAYVEDRPIYVFDEWAADQDVLFKEIFYMQILPELKARGKTVLVASHDDRYYHLADRIIKLDSGKIVD